MADPELFSSADANNSSSRHGAPLNRPDKKKQCLKPVWVEPSSENFLETDPCRGRKFLDMERKMGEERDFQQNGLVPLNFSS